MSELGRATKIQYATGKKTADEDRFDIPDEETNDKERARDSPNQK